MMVVSRLRPTLAAVFLIDLWTTILSRHTTLAFVPSNTRQRRQQKVILSSSSSSRHHDATPRSDQQHDSTPASPRPHHESSSSYYHSPPSSSSYVTLNFEDALYLERFRRRRRNESSSPPSPQTAVSALLASLLRPHSPTPHRGYRTLYSSSTERWRRVLRRSAGAGDDVDVDGVCAALSESMEREGSQFGILVGRGVDDGAVVVADAKDRWEEEDEDEEDYYTVEFPFGTLDYYDGTAWLECRLRDKRTDALLVVLGFSLCRCDDDEGGDWLVDGMEWQDFREKYRPGIGREMWERICG